MHTQTRTHKYKLTVMYILYVIIRLVMDAARVQSAINSIVECGICMDVYQDPRILSCGHTFCLKCLRETINKKAKNWRDQVGQKEETCALCKQSWKMPDGGVQNVPKNFVVEQIISSLPSISKCALNEEGNDHEKVEYFCVTCWEPLCNTCGLGHTKYSKQMLTHKVKRMVDINEGDIRSHLRQKSSTCLQHKNQELVLFCKRCNEICCTVCYAVSHASHECIDLKQAEDNYEDEMKKSLSRLRKTAADVENKLLENNKLVEQVENNHWQMLQDIKTFTNEEKKKLQAACDKAKKEMDSQEIELVKFVSNYYTAEKKKMVASVNELRTMRDKQQQAILEHEKQMHVTCTLKSKLNFIQAKVKTTELDMPPSQSRPTNNDTLSQLSIEEWKSDIAQTVQSLMNPFAANKLFKAFPVALINSVAIPAVNMNSAVIASINLKPMESYAIFPLRSPKYPIAKLAVRGNKILIGELYCTELFLYDVNGKFLSTLKLGARVFDATFTPNGNIICSKMHNSEVIVMSEDGEIVHSKHLQSPRCISVSADGIVFVTDAGIGVFQSRDNGCTWSCVFNVTTSSWNCWQTIKIRNDQGEAHWLLEVQDEVYRIRERTKCGDQIIIRSLAMKIPNGTDVSKTCTRMVYNDDRSILLLDTKNSSVHSFSVNNCQHEKQLLGSNDITRPTMQAIDNKNKLLYIGQEDGTLKILKLR